MKRALLAGMDGQVDSYLTEFLLNKGCEVWGMYRRSPTPKFQNISQIIHKVIEDLQNKDHSKNHE